MWSWTATRYQSVLKWYRCCTRCIWIQNSGTSRKPSALAVSFPMRVKFANQNSSCLSESADECVWARCWHAWSSSYSSVQWCTCLIWAYLRAPHCLTCKASSVSQYRRSPLRFVYCRGTLIWWIVAATRPPSTGPCVTLEVTKCPQWTPEHGHGTCSYCRRRDEQRESASRVLTPWSPSTLTHARISWNGDSIIVRSSNYTLIIIKRMIECPCFAESFM